VTHHRPRELDADIAAELRAIAAQLPALTDDQLDSLADVLVQIELRGGK
jgi:hypothetical protein